MSQISLKDYNARIDAIDRSAQLSDENIKLRPGAVEKLALGLIAVGLVGLALTVAGAFVYNLKHALAAYEIGVLTVTAASLGGLFWVMIMALTNAGWHVTVRRLFEHLGMMVTVCIGLIAVMLVVELSAGGVLLTWLGIDPATNPILAHKAGYLNAVFLGVRFVVYAGLWIYLATRFWKLSVDQDATGDRTMSNRARRTSAWGLIAFGLSITFFSFDYLMSPDYRMFSTMWGVWFFASTALGGISVVVVILAFLRTKGYLTGVVTNEHTHDLGKLLFGFTAFWAYISFSQYFLIWYSDIPEETVWFLYRTESGFKGVATVLIFGHFIVPFLLLLFRTIKRSAILLGIMAVWTLLMVALDMAWVLLPMVEAGVPAADRAGIGAVWVDIAGFVGVVALWSGLLIRRIAAGPLIPIRDPKLPEALHHRNYV